MDKTIVSSNKTVPIKPKPKSHNSSFWNVWEESIIIISFNIILPRLPFQEYHELGGSPKFSELPLNVED